ncbi:MAG TPA: isoleucine--tRNA ligase [Gaiellaceae bacterium]|nr:isoleucine--tRNA ligase [Gaiellaceae bacterium]
MFRPLPRVPDHPAIELGILDWWEEHGTFERLREQNRGNPHWSFVDGPVTANKTLAVHTAWGRTLKDVFQRYKALRGFDQRYQNGFDCQGLWIEVGVERELGLNSKREIEEYGLAEFARKCREKVIWSATELTRGSQRLGQWMDWGNDYYTFSDTNIEYIWRFLRRMHDQGWLYLGHRSTEWCPRCGTSISAHELVGNYEDRIDPSLFVRFPLVDRPGEALAVWTTTPWTLPANVAAAVNPEAEYGLRPNGDWVAVARDPEAEFAERAPGRELVGLRYEGPFDNLPAAEAVEHRVIPWEDVSLEEGTGIVHIAPGCGAEDFELSREHDLAVLAPVDEAGRFYADYGWLHGQSTGEAAEQIVVDLAERGRLIAAEEIEHRFPFCWRCHTPLIFRIADDWFIAVDELRPRLLAANATVAWTPEYFGKRMDDWLRNMGDWNISRRRYYGLPLPIYPCSCGHVNVVGSKAELLERSTVAVGDGDLPELRRPWIDEIPIACDSCGEAVTRIPEVGDVWLDAGIVPFSTLGWQNPEHVPGGYATGAAAGLTGADLPDHRYWEQWFPAHWVSEMREQIRLWFYSQLFMSVALVDRAPFREVLGYEKMLDEHGREMHGSWGNMIDAEDAFARMGADVMRWQFCAQPPDRNLLFGYGPAKEIKRRLLTLWNSVRFLVDYGNIQGFSPSYADLDEPPAAAGARPLDRWLVARTRQYVREATDGFEAQLTYRVIEAFEAFVDDLSNWYIRRSRRRFWDGDEAALRTLWYALVQGLRGVAPVMPFLAEHLWRNLVAGAAEGAPESVFLAGWPEPGEPDAALLEEIAEVRAIVELGREARGTAGRKLRQPLRTLVVEGAERALAHAAEIGEELRVKEVSFEPIAGATVRAKPNLKLLGPKLGGDLPRVREALAAGRFERLEDGRVRVDGVDLGPDEVFVERAAPEGWTLAEQGRLSVALDARLDPDLELEGRVYDLVHTVNGMRRDQGLEITDRIVLTLPDGDDLAGFEDWIKSETLAGAIERGPELALRKASRS